MVKSWLDNRHAYINFRQYNSDKFDIKIGLPQECSLSPYLFIVYHCDLIKCLEVHSGHLFAGDLSALVKASITKAFFYMIEYLEKEGTRLFDSISKYAEQ